MSLSLQVKTIFIIITFNWLRWIKLDGSESYVQGIHMRKCVLSFMNERLVLRSSMSRYSRDMLSVTSQALRARDVFAPFELVN